MFDVTIPRLGITKCILTIEPAPGINPLSPMPIPAGAPTGLPAGALSGNVPVGESTGDQSK